jgi:hypothetical protein
LIYADWLDEHGRPGGSFLRIECEAAQGDPYTDEGRETLSKLRHACRDLTDQWIDDVSRLSSQEIFPFSRALMRMLRRRHAVVAGSDGELRWDITPPKPAANPGRLIDRILQKFRNKRETSWVSRFQPDPIWAAARMTPGDELWQYSTYAEDEEGDTLSAIHEIGFAIVRNGRALDYVVLYSG